MHVISRKRLVAFWQRHPESESPLTAWFKVARSGEWANLSELRNTFSASADLVGYCTVFNIGGNRFRLITHVDYEFKRIYVRHVLTHAEYDRDAWKGDCGCG